MNPLRAARRLRGVLNDDGAVGGERFGALRVAIPDTYGLPAAPQGPYKLHPRRPIP